MTTTTYRSGLRAGRDAFAHLLRAEWTKFRTVRGWVIGMVVAALVTVLLGLLFAANSHMSCSQGPKEVACPAVPVGPDGQAVRDRFSFVHQPLTGDGSITVRLTSMTGIITYPPRDHDKIVPGLVPWAKAGVIIKDGTRPGSAYAAMMVTAGHGVRMQHNYTHDTAGRPGGISPQSPRWLRLSRSGDSLTGYESPDGKQWIKVGTALLAGLPATVRVGLFVSSPGDLTVKHDVIGGSIAQARFTETTGVFDNVTLQGSAPGGAWSRDDVGIADPNHHPGRIVEAAGSFTVAGSGDIAPLGQEGGLRIESTLTGALTGLMLMIVVAVMFITAEYRRGLIRTSVLASPRRGRALVAKAVVIGTITFIAGLVAVVVTVPLCTWILRANGNHVLPVTLLTELRVIVGTAALLAVATVFALALGALFRRSAAAVITAFAVIVLPYILATTSFLPVGASQWLLRVTPAAALAIQQSIPAYPHVLNSALPQDGYYPLPPWAGFAMLCGYTTLALGLAVIRLRRRDA